MKKTAMAVLERTRSANRGYLWYSGLNIKQWLELKKWYLSWLNVTDTLTIPDRPDWLDEFDASKIPDKPLWFL